ncbi:crossover junction endodeoxyribonuclease RuvC [Candidatus Parcubacteria bacterium]|nr:crossover junction endodeoxyribonuclease RuvC [Candidatus Parcubacteria bacterium]
MPEQGYIILGLDPGFGRMGFGVVFTDGKSVELLDYGVAVTVSGDTFENRLLSLASDLHDLCTRHRPHLVAVEKLYFGKMTTNAMKVAEARGVALLMAAQSGAPVLEFTPAQVKLALTGDGKAGKAGVQRMVKELLGLPQPPKPDDAADALAVAITAANKKW